MSEEKLPSYIKTIEDIEESLIISLPLAHKYRANNFFKTWNEKKQKLIKEFTIMGDV